MKYKILIDKRLNYCYPNFFFDVVLPLRPEESMSLILNLEPNPSVNSTVCIGFNEWNIPQHCERSQQQKDAEVQNYAGSLI